MILTGQVTTDNNVSGQFISIILDWLYPEENEPSYVGEDQPLTPPVELASVEIRLTDDASCLIDINNQDINWEYRSKGTSDEPTADFINGEWVGRSDSITINNLPVRAIWYYQARCWSRSGIPSDWTDIYTIVDSPEPVPTPEFIDYKTNSKDQVRLEWTSIKAQMSNFSHYELVKEEVDVTRRLDVNAVIVGE